MSSNVWKKADPAMDVFTLRGGEGLLQIRLDEVYWFPDHTSGFGGYDARGTLVIDCRAYHVRGPLYFSTGEIWQFYSQLRLAYDAVSGSARFLSSERNLDFTVQFDARGHWIAEGYYHERFDLPTRLRFAITSDQSYLPDTLNQLARIVAIYGDNFGRRV